MRCAALRCAALRRVDERRNNYAQHKIDVDAASDLARSAAATNNQPLNAAALQIQSRFQSAHVTKKTPLTAHRQILRDVSVVCSVTGAGGRLMVAMIDRLLCGTVHLHVRNDGLTSRVTDRLQHNLRYHKWENSALLNCREYVKD